MNKRVQIAGKELPVSTVEAQQAIWDLAPRDWIGKRKAAIAKIANDLKWPFARTWNIAHGRARLIRSEEMDQLRVRLNEVQEGAAKRREMANGIRQQLAAARSARAGGDRGGSSGGDGTHDGPAMGDREGGGREG